MRQGAWVLIALAGTAIAVAAGVVTGRAIWAQPETTAATEPGAPLPDLYIADDKLDLGEVWESRDAVLTVPISNRTDKPIEILDFESSCDCGEISPRRLTVPANGSANVSVKMDLTRRGSHQRHAVRRVLSFGMKPITAAGPLSLLTITGIVRSALLGDFGPILFDDWCVKDGPRVVRSIQYEAQSGASLVKCSSDNPHVLAEKGNSRILVTVDPATPLGPYRANITLECSVGDPKSVCKYVVEVSGHMSSK